MSERKRPPRASAPFFMAGGESDFYGNPNDDEHSDGELFPSQSSHNNDLQHSQSEQNHYGSSADAYRVSPSDRRFSLDGLPPSPNPPLSARPFLPPGAANTAPSGYPAPSPSLSRQNSYRLSYPGPLTQLVASTQRAFPPSAFVDPSAGAPLAPNGQPSADYAPSSSQHAHSRRASSDDLAHRTFGPAQRNSSITSFAPPPAPWMRTESWHDSQSSVSFNARGGALTPKKRSALPSTLIKAPIEKPWTKKEDPWVRVSWWITVLLFILGLAVSAILCFFAYKDIPRLGNICLVMEDDFDNLDTSNTWTRDVNLGGLRDGDFAMFTGNSTNSYTQDGTLFIVPTLTRDEIGDQAVTSGGTYRLAGCTSNNASACTARSGNGRVINPVQSARLTTQNTYNIRYGRVEIRARLPKGDWLRPQIAMLPLNNVYGDGFYPVSGEIDILQARGNGPSYPKQGRNFVTSGLHWAPTHMPDMDQFYKTYGWRSMRRGDFSDDFHTYVLEWSDSFMWTYIDKRTARIIDLRFDQSFWHRGNFPSTVLNNTDVPVVLQNPWAGSGNSAPFDQAFYLTLMLGAGGTDGWFQDGQGGKMWYDGSSTAMLDFTVATDDWYATWASDQQERAFAIDYVKMWNKC